MENFRGGDPVIAVLPAGRVPVCALVPGRRHRQFKGSRA
jgi:hypothetical protein